MFCLFVLGECVISLVLSHPSQDVKCSQVLQLRILFSKRRKVHPHECRSTPKERPLFFRAPKLKSVLASSFYIFVYCSLKPPYVNWASQEECVFHLKFSLQPSDFLLFHFWGLFLSLSFSHRHFGLLFPILTT